MGGLLGGAQQQAEEEVDVGGSLRGAQQWLTSINGLVTVIVGIVGLLAGGFIQNIFSIPEQIEAEFPRIRYVNFDTIHDRTTESLITVDVPHSWQTSRGEDLYYNDEIYGPAVLAAASDTVRWWPGYEDSGLYLGASDSAELINLPLDKLMQRFTSASDVCSKEGLVTRQWKQPDRAHQGHNITYRVWSDCGGKALKFIDFVAKPKDGQYVVVGLMTIANEGDWKARERVFDSLAVDPDKFQIWKQVQTPSS